MDRGLSNSICPLSNLARLNEAQMEGLPNPTTSSFEEHQAPGLSASGTILSSFNRFMSHSDSGSSSDIIAQWKGILAWKIRNIKEQIRNQNGLRKGGIVSPAFQTPDGVQRVCVYLYLNGDNDSKYLAIYLLLLTPLRAAFHGVVKFTIVDQSEARPLKHLTRTCSGSLDQIGDRLGFDTFADKNRLHVDRSRYVRDDTIMLSVQLRSEGQTHFANLPSNLRDALGTIRI
jgi:hypothetical protein